MPQHKSNVKRMRTSKKANLKNRKARSEMRSSVKKVLDVKSKKDSDGILKEAISILDKNVKKGIIHKNNAANKKSRLQKKINALKA